MTKDFDFLRLKQQSGMSYTELSQFVPLLPGRISQCANGFTLWGLGVREVLVEQMQRRIEAQASTLTEVRP